MLNRRDGLMVTPILKEQRDMSPSLDISVVLPIYNESPVIEELLSRLQNNLDALGRSYEVICVNDGSKDDSLEKLKALARGRDALRILSFGQNRGQTAALDAGIQSSQGKYVILMDADLQHDPSEIGLFVEGLDHGYDIVSGWRKCRVDGFLRRRLPSLVANTAMRRLCGIDLHDFGTTFKGYRGDMIREVRLYARGFHRFIPALLKPFGPRILEVPISNIVRPQGKSSYTIARTIPVFWDIIKLSFIVNFAARPLDCVGPISLVSLAAGTGMIAFLVLKKIVTGSSILANHGFLFLLSILLVVTGLQMLLVGLVMELQLYYSRHGRRPEGR